MVTSRAQLPARFLIWQPGSALPARGESSAKTHGDGKGRIYNLSYERSTSEAIREPDKPKRVACHLFIASIMSRPAPRLILVRHGETPWTITGYVAFLLL